MGTVFKSTVLSFRYKDFIKYAVRPPVFDLSELNEVKESFKNLGQRLIASELG
jgi:hypothetical protein